MAAEPVLAGVEGGGSSYVVTIARGSPLNIVDSLEFPTTTPEETLGRALEFIRRHRVDAVGVAHFGPIDLVPGSPTYGYVTATPKLAWRNADVLSRFRQLGVPVGWNTDVQAAALGEMAHGGHGGVRSCCYATVGTGVGVGVVSGGRAVFGLSHPEVGHIPVRRHPDDPYRGECPYHGDCLEGLANSRAVAARAGCEMSELRSLPDDHPVWDVEAFYLAQMCATLTLVVSPEVIVMGGGVMQRKSLFPKVRAELVRQLAGYVPVSRVVDTPELYVVPSVHDSGTVKARHAGSVGALELARSALLAARSSA